LQTTGCAVASRPPTDRCTSARRRRELHRQRSKLALQRAEFSTARRPHPNTQSSGVALEHRKFAGSPNAPCNCDIVAITGFTAPRAGRISDDRRPTSTVARQGVLDHARVDEPTRTESCSASPTSRGRSASTPHMSARARSVSIRDTVASTGVCDIRSDQKFCHRFGV
jgi:hypothetical protein